MTSLTEDITPFAGTVDGEVLLDLIVAEINKYTILPSGAADALALWCFCTYCIDNFRIFPKLFICSPTKRCGKTTVLEVVASFSHRSLTASGISPAVIFRAIEQEQPTLLIDEADMHLKHASGDMTAILNSGHTRSLAYVLRCKPKTLEPEKFSTWAPMAIAAIGTIQSTVMDRSITIPLQRMMNSQKHSVTKLPCDLADQMVPVREKLLKWSRDNAGVCKANVVEPPGIGNDRAQDNWRPLFTVAALISHRWLAKCDTAYRLLEATKDSSDPHDMLLADIHAILQSNSDKHVTSEALIQALTASSDSMWTEYSSGKPITPRGLASLLKGFGIRPKAFRRGTNANNRGYEVADFDDAFKRYL